MNSSAKTSRIDSGSKANILSISTLLASTSFLFPILAEES